MRAEPHLGPRSWIFQSNPRLYDIESAVRDLDEQTWLVHQNRSEIKAGHTVFLWETGPAAGVIAIGTIALDPVDLPVPEHERQYVRRPGKFEGIDLRTVVRIDFRLARPLTRDVIIRDSLLAKLPNLAFASKSNYPVTDEQASRLLQLSSTIGFLKGGGVRLRGAQW